jgi:hypothetical protein
MTMTVVAALWMCSMLLVLAVVDCLKAAAVYIHITVSMCSAGWQWQGNGE